MAVKKDAYQFIIRNRKLCVTFDCEHFPSNVRKAAADVLLELVDRLLSQGSDDTKSLCRAINVSILVISQISGIGSKSYLISCHSLYKFSKS